MIDVDEVEPDGLMAQLHLPGARRSDGPLFELQNLGAAGLAEDDGAAHGFFRGADFGRA